MCETLTTAIIIPSYCETLALPALLQELKSGLSSHHAVLIMDDSPEELSQVVKNSCISAMTGSTCHFIFDNAGVKSGRGAAVRRGMVKAFSEFPNLEHIMECDADGSHRAVDILKILNSESDADLLVGSRYLPTSKIVGWPFSRRIFSYLLNHTIPRIIHVNLCDITNGLRKYSKDAAQAILSKPQINMGFIYLSEQAITVSNSGLKIAEEPIEFIDRTLGTSTVTWREISNSLSGIGRLIVSARHL
jgi:dolichol-phosphate mannosyltransferase